MLVLARRLDERIIITTPQGEVITIAVHSMRPDNHGRMTVRLAFEAPVSISINRQEVEERIHDAI